MIEPRIVVQQSDYVVAGHGALVVCIVDGVNTADQIGALATEMHSRMEANANGIALLFVIRTTAQLPTSDVRHRFDTIVKESQGKLKLMAAVVEGEGFLAAAKRSVFTAVSAHFLGKVVVKVFATTEQACMWLSAEGRIRQLNLPPIEHFLSFAAALPKTAPRER